MRSPGGQRPVDPCSPPTARWPTPRTRSLRCGAAIERLSSRGLVEGDQATAAGRALRDDLERRTDELALAPFVGTDPDEVDRLLTVLDPAVARVAAAGGIAFPNPMGLPRPG